LVSLVFVSTASGTIHLEVTRSGDLPDGATDFGFAYGETASLDIWIWGTGVDTSILTITFGATGHGGEWSMDALGIGDPDGRALFSTDGTIDGFDIVAIEFLALPPVAIGGGMDQAVMIYQGFVATNLEPGGRVDPFVTLALTDSGNDPTVRTYGIVQTPTPGTLGVFMMLGAGRRRRR
ncbi:MAG: hypothetical protein KDA28_17680, partial [Phycisphaerales bacterium]|nr:hypothetical protein [Phycisphaerales bacterium]